MESIKCDDSDDDLFDANDFLELEYDDGDRVIDNDDFDYVTDGHTFASPLINHLVKNLCNHMKRGFIQEFHDNDNDGGDLIKPKKVNHMNALVNAHEDDCDKILNVTNDNGNCIVRVEDNHKHQQINGNLIKTENVPMKVIRCKIESVPMSLDRLKSIIYDLDPSHLNESPFNFKKQLKSYKTFKTHNTYIKVFIPLILQKFYYSLQSYKKHHQSVNCPKMTVKEMISQNAFTVMKCYVFRGKTQKCTFSFGQILALDFVKDDKRSNDAVTSSFGIVQKVNSIVFSDRFSVDDLLESNISPIDAIVDEIDIELRPLNAKPILKSVKIALNSVQHVLLQARAVFEINNFKIGNEILKPIYTSGCTGISINMDKRTSIKYLEHQLDAMQKSYQIFFVSDLPFSSTVAIYGARKSGKTEVLRELILQLCKFADLKIEGKLLVIVNSGDVKSIVEQLTKHNIKVYHISNDKDFQYPPESVIKQKSAELSSEFPIPEMVQSDCKSYFDGKTDRKELSPFSVIQCDKIYKSSKIRLMEESRVIIGKLNDICCDELFNYAFFQEKDQNYRKSIKNVLIDDAECYSEPEIVSLLCFGVEKIVLFGHINENALNNFKVSKPFLNRYVEAFKSADNRIDKQNISIVNFNHMITHYINPNSFDEENGFKKEKRPFKSFNKQRNDNYGHSNNDNNYRGRYYSGREHWRGNNYIKQEYGNRQSYGGVKSEFPLPPSASSSSFRNDSFNHSQNSFDRQNTHWNSYGIKQENTFNREGNNGNNTMNDPLNSHTNYVENRHFSQFSTNQQIMNWNSIKQENSFNREGVSMGLPLNSSRDPYHDSNNYNITS